MARQPTPVKVVVLRYGFSFGEDNPSPKPGEIITVPHTQVTQLEGQRIVINHARYKKDKAEYDAFIAEQRVRAGVDKTKADKPKSKPEAKEPKGDK